jgi:T5SS/PEP-CTERM-associated repeat protein
VVLGDFIKQTTTGSIPYAASVPTTTANSVTVNSGGFTFDFGPHLAVGEMTLPGNSSGLTVTADTGFMVGTTAFGGSGTATLTVTGPGQLSTTDAQIGIGVGVTGMLTLSGSQTTWVDTGGQIGSLIIGNNFNGDPSGGTGTVNVIGGATLNANGGMTIGNIGSGTLNVNGATASVAYMVLGAAANSSGAANIGASSTVTSSGIMVLGYNGNGSVTVQQGGTLRVQTGAATSQLTFDLGVNSGSSGQLTVTSSGSSLATTGLGQGAGTATVIVQNGGSIAANVFEIGGTAGGTGQATISGTNSNVIVTLGVATQANGFFGIGQFGQGTLTINGAGSATAPFVLIGEHPGAVGQITVSDSHSTLQTTQILSVGTGYVPSQGLDVGPNGGTGTLRVTGGGSAAVGQQLAMGNGGTVTLDAGGDMLVGSDPLPTTPATLQIANGGTISGTGTISANIVFSSSTSSTYSGSIVDAVGGIHSLMLNGSAGTLSLAGTSTFTGGITIGAGTLNINSDAALGAVPSTPASNITFSGGAPGGALQFAMGFAGGLLAPNRSIIVNPTSAGTIDTNSNNVGWGGALFNSGTFTKVGVGTLNIGGLTLGNNSVLRAQGGTLRLNVGSASTVGTGVTATISAGATLELAGSASALSAGANRVNIISNSTSPGLLVSGTHQQVGGIDGPGTAQINAGSDLTANHIVQSALAIGGAAGSPGRVTIDASDSAGNPLGQQSDIGLVSALDANGVQGGDSLAALATTSRPASSARSLAGSPASDLESADLSNANTASVPEPASLILTLAGITLFGGWIAKRGLV